MVCTWCYGGVEVQRRMVLVIGPEFKLISDWLGSTMLGSGESAGTVCESFSRICQNMAR